MPQKRNPDAAELVRAKTGRIVGALTGAADGDEGPAARLPEGHAGGQGRRHRRARRAVAVARRDDRHGARHGARCGAHAQGGRRRLFDRDRSRRLAGARRSKMPFREAHHVTGRIVARGGGEGRRRCTSCRSPTMQAIEPRITEDVFAVLSVEQFGRRAAPATAAPRRRMSAREARRWLQAARPRRRRHDVPARLARVACALGRRSAMVPSVQGVHA